MVFIEYDIMNITHPGFLKDHNKILAWLGLTDENYSINADKYVIDPVTFEVNGENISIVLKTSGFIRVKFSKVFSFSCKNCALLSLVGMPNAVISSCVLSDMKHLMSFDGLDLTCNSLSMINITNKNLLSFDTLKNVKAYVLNISDTNKVSLVGISKKFDVSAEIVLKLPNLSKGGIELLDMTQNNKLKINISSNGFIPNEILKKYLSKKDPYNYTMDCMLDFLDNDLEMYTITD